MQRIEQNWAGGTAYLAQWPTEQDVLHPDVTIDGAADLLRLLASFEPLYVGRDLSIDEVARMLVTTAQRSLRR